ncbi:MAG: phenylacetate--CoA ligase family protein [Sedimentisphaerales bacterium]|nr:phenylacetate--CoA ligase family protein [Sedimentisphaerales bacterium]
MNWRRPLIYSLLYASGSRIPQCLKTIKRYEFASREQIEELKNTKLEKLLLHAYNNVPYYHKLLPECDVVKDGKVMLDNFSRIPLLTKEIIRTQSENLYSSDYKNRKPYENTSGGSTGEPVKFIQDKEYDDWNIATKLYFNAVIGKDLGESEIKFWGSDRDILAGNLTIKDRLINRLYNRKFFNSYRLGEKEIKNLIELNNRFKPKAYWAYMESALELANYLSHHELYFHPPEIVISTIGPLTDEVKEKIETNMNCKVYNQYGSREVGAISCQCKKQRSMHTFPWWNHVEILDEHDKSIQNQEGRVVVTTFHNYSMPLIRYEIGDVAVAGGWGCDCGRNSMLLKKVIGRTLGYFKKADGSLVHSHFLVQALFFRDWIKRFQIIQDEIDHVLIKVQLNENASADKGDIEDITRKTKILMGDSCKVDFDFVEQIHRTTSGKYVYTLCKVK